MICLQTSDHEQDPTLQELLIRKRALFVPGDASGARATARFEQGNPLCPIRFPAPASQA